MRPGCRPLRKILLGLSCRDYQGCSEAVPGAFGLSPSNVCRRFILASARQIQALQERRLDGNDIVALVRDGKTFPADSMVIALGIPLTGGKVILGFVQTATENATICIAFLRKLVARGLEATQGPLVVLDGAKGIRASVTTVFGGQAVVQRCQWSKRKNVLEYMPKSQQPMWRRKLQAAYQQPTEAVARTALGRLRQEPRLVNVSAVGSLDEGFAKTLTLHRLGLFPQLGVSLMTTNCLKSLNSLIAQLVCRVDRWRTSDHKHRWLAAALLKIELRIRRIRGYRTQPLLRQALLADVQRPHGGLVSQAA